MVATPCGESPASIQAYFDAVRDAYGGVCPPDRAGYQRLWERVGMDTPSADAVMKVWDRLSTDPHAIGTVGDLCETMAASRSLETLI